MARHCPQAIRCADPFHVVRWATDALDEVRRQIELAERLDAWRSRGIELRLASGNPVLRYLLDGWPQRVSETEAAAALAGPLPTVIVVSGPLLVPDFESAEPNAIDRLEMAHVAYNRLDRAEFILRRPTPIVDASGAELCRVLHYSEVREYPATTLILSGEPRGA